ncbi:two-component system, chemotaxis family, response regulator CheY [Pseudidiomarina planktonica]|uniref:Two-component system, chemotaxis family, response regulator CheY n=1 Tax=Pseudidiomarina planktonica TaxID=1323738 RepID=A0A1Y6F564_9GAMM|nr:response regulator [Pseudidiomarina planktonica]RUO65043.1 two-component system response regulator [Pseudidiomarina planktonica]SMQ67543.1 two-component system, chemotaxis family, response regulator CheY [Pseudidiomarina planktonica]
MPDVQAADLSILLIEPSEVQRKVIKRHLAEAGITNVDGAACISEAQQKIKTLQPDIIASAMYFEDGTAHDLLHYIHEQGLAEDIGFMLVSSEYRDDQLEEFKQAGIIAILPKPFTSVQLQRAVNASIDLIEPTALRLQNFDPEDLSVLLVDDSVTSRHFLKRILADLGIDNFSEAENGQQAMEILQQQTFDLVVTDFHMPHMNGRELAEFIRQTPGLSHIPILMVTARASSPQLANIKQSGVDALTDKPFEPATLRNLLARLLDQ